jgi:TRAP-type C4-dicarboxylate transport system substrate-binding protein
MMFDLAKTLFPVLIGAIALMPSEASAKKVKIKLGTLAPEGSPWHNGLLRLSQRWKKLSNNQVEIKIYPGGVLGDEGDMVRKMRVGQLHAGTMTGVGLSVISRATYAMQTPMLFSSFEELDYVRTKMAPMLQQELEANGVVVLGWGDAGWAHFFSKEPARTVDDFRKMKTFVWAGDPAAELAWKAANFSVVPMSSTDVMSGLQTGLIESFCTTPLFALTSQWFTYAKNMTAVKWTPLNGATVMTKEKWEELAKVGDPAAFKQAADEEVAKTNLEVRALGEKSIKAMTERGLKVHEPTQAELAAWQKAAEAAYPTLREKVIPAKFFDEAQRLVKEYRAQAKK